MDALDRLAPAAADLLARVDATLARYGAPGEHPVWPLLRQLRAMPGEAVAALAELRTEPLAEAADPLRRLTEHYAQERDAISGEADWTGAAAASFARRQSALSRHLAGGHGSADTLAGRIEATAAHLSALADWVTAARDLVARAVAQALTSRQAVALCGTPAAGAWSTPVPAEITLAAADLAACVLRALAEAYDRGEVVRGAGAHRLAELPPPTFHEQVTAPPGGVTRVAP